MSDSFEETPQKVDAQDPHEASTSDHDHDTTAVSSVDHSPMKGGNDTTATDVESSPERAQQRPTSGPSKATAAEPKYTAADTQQQQQQQSQQQPLVSASGTRSNSRNQNRDVSPNRSGAGSRNGSLPPIGQGSIRRNQPLIASVSYPPRQDGLTVADFLDPSKPLVKSTLPLTKPKGPSFVEEEATDSRKQHHAEVRMQSAITSSQIVAQRNNERKYLKAQYEFEREKKIAERAIYHKERSMQWSQRLAASPFAVDLVADNERIEEEAYVREREEKHRQHVADRRKQRIKRAIIVKALAEVPLLEKARKEKRELVEAERREKALRDVQRVEAIQQRKLLDHDLMLKERQAKLDQRILSTTK